MFGDFIKKLHEPLPRRYAAMPRRY